MTLGGGEVIKKPTDTPQIGKNVNLPDQSDEESVAKVDKLQETIG